MIDVLIIGSGIAGLTAAINASNIDPVELIQGNKIWLK